MIIKFVLFFCYLWILLFWLNFVFFFFWYFLFVFFFLKMFVNVEFFFVCKYGIFKWCGFFIMVGWYDVVFCLVNIFMKDFMVVIWLCLFGFMLILDKLGWFLWNFFVFFIFVLGVKESNDNDWLGIDLEVLKWFVIVVLFGLDFENGGVV